MLSHSVRNQVCAGIYEDTVLHLIFPVIVMCHTSEACLDSTKDYRSFLKSLTNQITVYNNSTVRPQTHFTARRIRILLAVLFCNGIVINHGIHIAGTYKEAKARLSKYGNTLLPAPVGLWDNSHFIAPALQKAADNSSSKRGMIYVSISCHVDKIHLIPASVLHVFFCNW